MLCTAATDPYTRCGFKKLICISRIDDFVVSHLPNKYVGKLGIEQSELDIQIKALRSPKSPGSQATLFEPATKVAQTRWSKSYYEAPQHDFLSPIPQDVQNVLSIGCGWGKTEERLVKGGARVLALPMDFVIGACAKTRGITVVEGDFKVARTNLDHERFDCILLSNVLHLLEDPVEVLSSFSELLSGSGLVVASVPNVSLTSWLWRSALHYPQRRWRRTFAVSGMHCTNVAVMRSWFKRCDLRVSSVKHVVPDQWKMLERLSFGVSRRLLARELIVVGQGRQKYPFKRPTTEA